MILVGIFFTLLVVHALPVSATGVDADSMCEPVYVQCKCGEDPDPTTGVCQPGGKNKYMCPPGPQVCYDLTNNHMTTGTCDRPNHCKTDTCGGTECKQPKPGGEQSGEPKGGEKGQQGGGGQQGQGKQEQEGKGEGKGGQMPELPKPPQGGGKGGGQPQQQGRENCNFSTAFGIPCEEKVSTQLGNGANTSRDLVPRLESVANIGADENGDGGVEESRDTSAIQKVSTGLSNLWHRLTGTTDGGTAGEAATTPTITGTIAANSTFVPPVLADNPTPAQESSWVQNVAAWFGGLFR